MRFLVDMPLSPGLALWLSGQGHDVIHAQDAQLTGATDSAILERARKDGRVVVTADLDYPRLLAMLRAERPGVILFRGGNYGEHESVKLLKRALEVIQPEELARSIVVIEKARIRRRRLPLGSSI
jgi:predicted nuclease of predicted toxin-antitoxin system